jgi:hypothetical protein
MVAKIHEEIERHRSETHYSDNFRDGRRLLKLIAEYAITSTDAVDVSDDDPLANGAPWKRRPCDLGRVWTSVASVATVATVSEPTALPAVPGAIAFAGFSALVLELARAAQTAAITPALGLVNEARI